MIHEWDLSETNLHRISSRKYEVAVLPTAAIEPHNRHLPEGQDWLHSTYVARRSCELAWERCPSVICLPAIPYGVDCNQLDFPMAAIQGASPRQGKLRPAGQSRAFFRAGRALQPQP